MLFDKSLNARFLSIRVSQYRHAIAAVTMVVATTLSWQTTLVSGQEDPVVGAAERLRAARQQVSKEETVPNRVREATWRLLTGELAARPELSLSSEAYDALAKGLESLDDIVRQLEAEPELERQLAKDTQLTMRLDAALARRDETSAKRDLSRASEMDRLKQMRELNRAYRDLARQLVLLNTELTLGRTEQVKLLGAEAMQTLVRVEDIAGKRRDYYLLQDEPRLDEDETSELKLVKELLGPVAADVQTHHKALQAMMLNRLASLAPMDVRQALLEETATVAESAMKGASEPSVLALYARGASLRDLGRLKTQGKLLNTQAHADAAPQFQLAREIFVAARDKAIEQKAATQLITELDQQLKDLESPNQILQSSNELTQKGHLAEAVARLEFGLSVQRTESIITALVEARQRAGSNPNELEDFLNQAAQEGALKESDAAFQLLSGRVRVLGVWQQINDAKLGERGGDWRKEFIARLNLAREVLLTAVKSDSDITRWQAESYLALDEAGLLVLDGARNTSDAAAISKKLPFAIDELTHAIGPASPGDQIRFQEAVLAGRLAQGYLALRLDPDYRDSAQLAFAAAADVAAKLPQNTKALVLLGAPVLQALWGRDDASNLRLAQEERFLRQGLQRLMPAALALKFGSSQRAASSLDQVIAELGRAEQTWSPQTVLDVRETRDARETLVAEGRVLTVLGLIGAEQPAFALRRALSPWYRDLNDVGLTTLSLDDVWKQSSENSDPLLTFALALASEEYATATLSSDSDQCRGFLSLARKLQDHAESLLNKSAGQRDRFPYLAQMIGAAQSRLMNPDYYLKEALGLRHDLRLAEARKVLDAGTRRHPQARSLRDALVDTLIDEANLKPEQSAPLIQEALRRLEESLKTDQLPPAETLLTLGNLRERTGSMQTAIEAYRKVLLVQPSPEQRLKAQSRLVLLKLKSTAT